MKRDPPTFMYKKKKIMKRMRAKKIKGGIFIQLKHESELRLGSEEVFKVVRFWGGVFKQ